MDGRIAGDQKGKFYVFRIQLNDNWLAEVPDPYVNGGCRSKRKKGDDH